TPRRRVSAEDASDADREREREQQREERGEEAQEEDGRQVGPVGPRVAQQPAADGEIAVARAARHDSPACRFTVESTAAIEQPASWSLRSPSPAVSRPRTPQASHA